MILAVAALVLMIDLAIYLAWGEAGLPSLGKIAEEMQLVVLVASSSLNLFQFSRVALAVEYFAVALETAVTGAMIVAAGGASPEHLLAFFATPQDWSSIRIWTWESWELVWPAHLVALVFYVARYLNGEIRQELSNV